MISNDTVQTNTLEYQLDVHGVGFLTPSIGRGVIAATCGLVPSEENLARLQAAWSVDDERPALPALAG